jgi:opacity protein-like surface antigen
MAESRSVSRISRRWSHGDGPYDPDARAPHTFGGPPGALVRPCLAVVILAAAVGPVSAEWTIGAFAGAARTLDTSVRLEQPALATDVTMDPVHYRSESFEPPIYYGYRIGFFPGSAWLGIEGEFIHLKVVAETNRIATAGGRVRGEPVSGAQPIDTILERFAISHGVNLVLVNAVARRAIAPGSGSRPRALLVARLGAGGSVPHAESTIGGTSREQYEWGSFGFQAAAGTEVRLTVRLSAMVEYKFTHTTQRVSVVEGTARTPLATHHVVAGAAIHLGGNRERSREVAERKIHGR